MNRKPAVYLLVILPIFVIGGISIVIGLGAAYAHMFGGSQKLIPSPNGILVSLPALFLWIPLALLLANFVLFLVPPLRKVAEKYAAEEKRPGFLESQKQLGRVAFKMSLVCVPLIVLGFAL